jgi:type IV pilus assembly protein PilA
MYPRTRRGRTAGFTLIELLIVVVIIGILALIAIPKFSNTKGKANVTKLKADLRNLATAQEAYFYDNTTYTTNQTALNVSVSGGVSLTVVTADPMGWSATATHPQSWPLTGGIFLGAAPPPLAATTVAGVVRCQ